MEERQASDKAKALPLLLFVKTKDPFDLDLTDSRYPVGKWDMDAAGVSFLIVPWDRRSAHLDTILRAFKDATCDGKNSKATLEFPRCLTGDIRSHISGMARKCGLGASSSGIGDERFLTVYTSKSQEKRAKTKTPSLTPQQEREAMDMWRSWKDVCGDNKRFSQKEVAEMLSTGRVDPQLRSVYQQWKQQGRNLPTARQQGTRTAQQLFDNIEWVKPESGQVGQVFYNKVHLSESGGSTGGEGSYWTPEAPGSTLVLSQLEAIPTQGLTHAIVCTDTRLSDDSYVMNYFPHSVALSVICPSKGSSSMTRQKLVDCPHHPADRTSAGSPCDCTDKRVVEVIHPRTSHKLHANFCVLRYEAHVRLLVTSAGFSDQAWTRQGQLGWYCDLPLTFSPEVTQQLVWKGEGLEDPHPLASDLGYILHQLEVPQQTVWSVLTGTDFSGVSEYPHPLATDLGYMLHQLEVPQQTVWSVLTGADFSGVSECVRLIPSVPGRVWPRGREISHVGLVKLSELLSQVPWPPGEDPPMTYQTPRVDCISNLWLHSLYSSLAGQGKGLFNRTVGSSISCLMTYQSPRVDYISNLWLHSLYTSLAGQGKGLFNRTVGSSIRRDHLLEAVNHLQVVHPWGVDMDDVSNLPPSSNDIHMSWDGDMWSNLYDSRQGSYRKVAWNANTVMRTCSLSDNKNAGQYGWLLLGSHALTCTSWGEVRSEVRSGQKSSHDPFYLQHSWQLSVVILPRLTNKQGVSKLVAPDLSRWDLPGKAAHLCRCPPGGLPVPLLLKMQQKDKKLWHLTGQVKEVWRNGTTAVALKVPGEVETPSKLPLDEWPGPEAGYEANLHINVALQCGLDQFPPKGWMVDMLACVSRSRDLRLPYLRVVAVLHTWKGEEQPGRYCNVPNCYQHGPKHPQFTGVERHPHEFVVVGLDLDPEEPLRETYPDPKPPPGRDRLIGRLQRANPSPYPPQSGPGSKQDYSLEIEAVWRRYFTGI
ncbi:PREDICTED: uncharacterized protein LOC109485694 [Branchiostoma belcheri]|uniref:Uncharacterized protein LOC109485694 n=1 Tax=Branchiostoma belcheri TaxID=7741 RepID=A0A6P4ZUR3_BRABE|nr:PREDICTED: uncharacterized protein LOC109485694 [Branchiostoma belcheri]